MEEWSREKWEEVVHTGEKTALYVYTPMCGTCAVASKMMAVVAQLLPELKLGKANLNYMEQLAYDYHIESVPCLIVSEGGKVTEKVYAFQSVPFLYELLQKSID